MNWQEDKKKHYKVCYKVTAFFPLILRQLIAVFVLIGGAAKEIIWDKMLGKGCCEWDDFLADFIGCKDAVINKSSRF